MYANFLIGLREGLEAALIVSILVAYLVKSGHADGLRSIWLGVALAIAASLGFGAILTFTSNRLSFEGQELFGGTLSIIAVAFVTWMVFWMRRTARTLSRELRASLDTALTISGTALTVTAFIAVGREGLETSVFLWSATQAAGETTRPLLGATLGLITAAVLGYLFYKGALRINLSKFFTWTGAALLVVAAGVLAYGIHDLQEARVLPGLNNLAFDVSATVPPDSWYGVLLRGTINFTPATTWLQAIAWLAYLVPTAILFFRSPRGSELPASQDSKQAVPASTTSVES